MNKLLTWLVGLANPLWSRLGADPNGIRLILTAKLIMDDRSGIVMGRRQQQKKGMEWFMYLMLVLFGAGMIVLPVFMDDLASAIGLSLSFMIIYIGLLLIAEMSENLFDQRDIYVLLSRPINDTTLSLARILHIGVFSAKFALCLGGPMAIYLIIAQGIVPFLVYLLLVPLCIVITMTGTLVGYLVMLRKIPKHRLQKVMGWFQMFVTFIFFFAYQIPNLFGESFEALKPLKLVDTSYGFAFPGLWLGGLFKVLTAAGPGPMALLQGGLGLIAAIVGLWFYIRQSKGYVGNMLALKEAGSGGGPTSVSSDLVEEEELSPWRDRFANLLTQPNLGRVSFRFHWNVMLRDMGFKQRTYPGMIYLPVLMFIIFAKDSWMEGDFSVQRSQLFMLMYFLAWVTIIPLGQVKISEAYRASWIFTATGNEHPQQLQYGQLAAVLSMFYLPTVLLVYPLVLIIGGAGMIPDLLLSAGVVLLATLVYNSMDTDLPFSRSKEDAKFSNIGPMLAVSLLAGVVGTAHYFLSDLDWFVLGTGVLIWGSLAFWLMRLRR